MSAIEKRGEGRRAVAETLRKRGNPRDVAEAALAELPDDDAERALEFARTKVRGVDGKDYDASLRRWRSAGAAGISVVGGSVGREDGSERGGDRTVAVFQPADVRRAFHS